MHRAITMEFRVADMVKQNIDADKMKRNSATTRRYKKSVELNGE